MQIQKLKQSLAEKPLVIRLLIYGLIVVIYLSLFLWPQINELCHVLPEASRLKATIIDIEKQWSNFDSFSQKVAGMHEKLDSYERVLPSKKEIAALLEFLSDSAQTLDVRITEIKPIDIEHDEEEALELFYDDIPILLKAECGYHQLGRFVNKLEAADRFMKISDIKIGTSPYQVDHLYVQLIVVTYVMSQGKQ